MSRFDIHYGQMAGARGSYVYLYDNKVKGTILVATVGEARQLHEALGRMLQDRWIR